MTKTTATQLIRLALEQGESLTALDALRRFGVFRLAALVHALRRRGMPIESIPVTTPSGKRIARYRIAGNAPVRATDTASRRFAGERAND